MTDLTLCPARARELAERVLLTGGLYTACSVLKLPVLDVLALRETDAGLDALLTRAETANRMQARELLHQTMLLPKTAQRDRIAIAKQLAKDMPKPASAKPSPTKPSPPAEPSPLAEPVQMRPAEPTPPPRTSRTSRTSRTAASTAAVNTAARTERTESLTTATAARDSAAAQDSAAADAAMTDAASRRRRGKAARRAERKRRRLHRA